MGIGTLVRQLWKKKARVMIIGGALLSAASMGSAIYHTEAKEYGKAAGSGLTSMVLAFGTGWYSRKRYEVRKEKKENKDYSAR